MRVRTAVIEADGSRVDYGYDDLYRLRGETRTGSNAYSIAYTYDNAGNRVTKDHDGVVTTYTYNNRDQLTNESGVFSSIGYSYDASGRQVSKDSSGVVSTFTWMDNDRLQSVTNQNGTNNFAYDPKGQKVRSDDGTNVSNYLIDYRLPYGQVVAEYQDDLSAGKVYTYGLERLSQKTILNSSFLIHHYFNDGQMSVRNLTDASGNITDSYSYYGFGDALSSSGTTDNSFRYVGEELNGFTNLYNLRARWYNQGNGRLISVDAYAGNRLAPISLHKYLYANQSPISYYDPSGNMTLMSVMTAISVSNILASNARPIYRPTKYINVGLSIPNGDDSQNSLFDNIARTGNQKWKRVSSGKEMLSTLKEYSKNTRIRSITFAGHGWASADGPGIPGVGDDYNGFYTKQESYMTSNKAAYIQDMKRMVDSDAIKLAKFAKINIHSCRISSDFNQKLSAATNSIVVSAAGSCFPLPNGWGSGPGDWNERQSGNYTGFHMSIDGSTPIEIGAFYAR